MAKVAEQENPEFTSSHGNTKISTIYSKTTDEKNHKTRRKGLTQLKIQRRIHNKTSGHSEDYHPQVSNTQMGG